MDYLQAIAYIESLSPVSVMPLEMNGRRNGFPSNNSPSLDRIALFLKEAGSPQNDYPVIHIGGTNGKGSVTATVASVLRASGLAPARYIGPHLLRWNERYHIGGHPIFDNDFADLATRVRSLSEQFALRHPQYGQLTWFEFLTAMGFIYFSQKHVDFAAVEVGLGGRWDATNAVTSPLATCIVTVGMDHMHILGSTIGRIAAEKAGIIKAGIPVITAATGKALDVIATRADECRAPLVVCKFAGEGFRLSLNAYAEKEGLNRLEQILREKIGSFLRQDCTGGKYQRQNAVVACTVLGVCEMLGLISKVKPLDNLCEGLSQVYWPGRFQYMPEQRILLDGAHNEPAARALRVALDEKFPGARLFVLSAYQNKDVPKMMRHLLRDGDRVYTGAVKSRRAVFPAKELVLLARALGCRARAFSSVREAFIAGLSARRPAETVICTGSFVTVKESLLALGCRSVEDAIALTAATPVPQRL